MKRLWFTFTLLASLVLGLHPLAAEPQLLRVGYIPHTGFLEEDQPGHYCGYGYEYMEFLSRYGDWTFAYIPSTTWQECNEKLQSGAIDILPAMPGSYQTLTNVVRTEHVVGRLPMELILREPQPKPHMRLGNIPANPPLPSLPKIAQDESFTYDLVSYPLFYDMEEAFRRGEIDGYVTPMLKPDKTLHILAHFDRQSYRLLVRPDRQELLADLNDAMDQMLMDQPGIRDRLHNKYMRSSGSSLILSHREKNYLIDKKRLTAAIFTRERPYFYRDGGKPQGVFPGLIQQMSKDLNIEINLIETDSPDEATKLMQSGKIDFIVDTPCDFSWNEKLSMVPTQSYLQLEYVPVTRRGIAVSDAKRVACDTSMLHTQTYILPRYAEDQRLYIKDFVEGLRAVSKGRADIIFIPRSEISYLMEDAGVYNLEAASESAFSDSLSLGANKNADKRLWRILNKEVNHLDTNRLRDAVNADVRTTHVLNPQWLIYHYPLHAIGLALLLFCLIAGAAWYRIRMRKQHLAIVQHMAYTDMRYQLPNLRWLEQEAPKQCQKILQQDPDAKLFTAVFAMDSKASVALPYGRELLDKQLCDMAAHLKEMDWIVLTAAGSSAGQLVCVCRSENEAMLSRQALTAIGKHGYIETSDARIWLHMHVGLCALEAFTADELLQSIDRAQTACQEAQSQGNDLQVFNAEMQKELTLTQQMESYMEKALENGEFQAWYQPKYDLRTRRVIGAEALVRWLSPDLGFLPPGRFIPLFEKNGFVIPLDYFLLETTCRLLKERLEAGKEVVPISVNQSRLHITEEDYLEKMNTIVKKYNLPPRLLELELTETVFGDFDQPEQRERARSIVRSLHSMGFKISVDDFGAGYSSYMLLNYLPLDVMKIDRSMLMASDDSDRMRAILSNIIQLGEMLGMEVICEGIETPEQEKLLIELGCCYGQGYLNAKPMPEADFITFFDTQESRLRESPLAAT